MSTITAVAFRLPGGWTPRRVAAALAREWLPPFLAETHPKAPRWILQPVVEAPPVGAPPLWEAGISTEEYQERLEHVDLTWAIRANVARGRGKGAVLARLRLEKDQQEVMQLTVFPASLPESLFDPAKVGDYLQDQAAGIASLLVSLLCREGIEPVTH